MEAGFIPAGNTAAYSIQQQPQTIPVAPGSKVIRAPGLKRGKPEGPITDRIKLETVLGLTVTSNAALDVDPNSEVVAYPAGCTVVLYNTKKNKQSHILSTSRKTITCVAFSGDGRYLATGECGHAPCVRIWDLQYDPQVPGATGPQVAEFPSHKYGVNCVSFSVNSKYLVSVGSQHDMIVNVWEWRAGLKFASNKVSSKVRAVSFNESGDHFVTVGNRHVKFWYLQYSRSTKYKEPVPLMGRSAILGELRNNDFCDVACGRGECANSTYAITKGGLLCEFNNRRLLDKWVELRTPSANCMSIGTNFIFVGCADGIVRCFSPSTLEFVTTLPRTHYLGVDVSQGLNISHMFSHPPGAKYPDTIALTYDEKNHKLTCVYNDHSLYVWDVRDIKRVGKSHSSLYHTACIWGVEIAPETNESDESPLPPNSFLTCSSDDTVRVWTLPGNGAPYANIYSDELQRVLYMDPELTYLKNVDLSSAGEKDKPVSYDGKNGVRCIRISGDGQQLAAGDRAGNVRIHDLNTLAEVYRIEAHNAEVLCLEYCGGSNNDSGRRLLASASRDRLIHIFDVDEGYRLMQTLEDHSASITAVRFLSNDGNLQMVSCGADKTILFRSLSDPSNENNGSSQFVRGHNCVARSTLYDMEVDSGGRHILVACQDRGVRVYSTRTGRHTKTFRGSVGDDGSLIKMVLDRTGIYVATSCTNKSLCVYDYYSGECMATMYGHSEVVTGLSFTPDCQHLISASGDGCIFIWKVPHDMVVTMRARMAQQAIRQKSRRPASSNGITVDSESERAGSPMIPGHLVPSEDPLVLAMKNTATANTPQLDLGRLPPWAQKTIAGDAGTVSKTSNSPLKAVVRGKWAQRAEKNDYKDYYLEPERPTESDGSKDSSLDSGTDTRTYIENKQDIIDPLKLTVKKYHVKPERPRSLNLSMLDMKMKNSIDQLIREWAVPVMVSTKTMFYENQNNGFCKYDFFHKDTKLVKDYNENVPTPTKFPRGVDRIRHHTDDSSLGSFKYEDHESTEHDGDIEDISDGERTSSSEHNTRISDRIIYYPNNSDDKTPSEFTVNAMDIEELRQSQRRMKKPNHKLPIVTLSATSVSGSGQDSDDDEDEASTPSGDNADRNPLSGSCESLERIAQRTSFLKSAFESLSGAEMDYNSPQGKSSISSQHHKSSNRNSITNTPVVPPRNAALISAAKQTLTDPGTTSKRQELTRRIEETKKQLESVGYRSKLKASQSTMDLSYRNDKDSDSRPVRARPMSQNISAGSGPRGYNSEIRSTNPSQFTTNNPKCAPDYRNHAYYSGNNDNNENFFDSLNCTDLNRNRQKILHNDSYKNPYDIPANLNSKYTNNFSCKLDDLNTGASEFIKKRHGQFEMLSNENKPKHLMNTRNNGNNHKPKGYAFTIDFNSDDKKNKNPVSKSVDNNKNGKVFDRLFPNANGNSSQNRNFTLNLISNLDMQNNSGSKNIDKGSSKSQKARSILKNYKSCPVSPVSEECKWGDINSVVKANPIEDVGLPRKDCLVYNQKLKDIKKRNSLSYFMDFDTTNHLMKDNGKSLVDTIKSDTEKMIAEITKKYGDLDDYEPKTEFNTKVIEKAIDKSKSVPDYTTKLLANEKEDGNFSSDSLEDCSLNQDLTNRNKVFTKRICKKHHKTSTSTVPRRCVSDYEIYGGMEEHNANYINHHIEMINLQVVQCDIRQQKSFTLPKNMPSNLDDYADEFYFGSQDQITNQQNNNFQRCTSALTKRCVSRSNESILTDENSNCSSISNEIFMKCGDQGGFAQRKFIDKQCLDDSQNCSYENLCYEVDAAYLEKHRHSSASFFLNQRKIIKNSASQESVLSDDLLPSDSDNQMMSKTNCNSLESILSDDSEYTKSAPLEMLFEHKRHSRKPEICSSTTNAVAIPKYSHSCYEFDQSSKSYGSSPNNTPNFGAYMYHNIPNTNERSNFITNVQNTIARNDDANIYKTVTRSVSLQDSTTHPSVNKRNIAYYFNGSEIKEYNTATEKPRFDEIPSMKSKNQEYESNQRKSLLSNCEEKYKYLCNVEGMETSHINKSKSCSFEVLMEPTNSVKPMPKRITEKALSHVQKNLEKFENQIRKNAEAKTQKGVVNRQSNNCNKNSVKAIGVTKSLERNTGQGNKNSNGKPAMEFVPHKPPKPVKRTSSVKLTNRNRFNKPSFDKYPELDTGLGANVRAKIDGIQLKNSNSFVNKKNLNDNNSDPNKEKNIHDESEKSFNVYVAENDTVDNKSEIQMDSLEYIALQKKKEKASDISLDSLDTLDERPTDAFSKDSLNYESFGESSKFDSSHTNLTANNYIKSGVSNKNMPFLKNTNRGIDDSSENEFKLSNVGSSIDSLTCIGKISSNEDVTMFKDIERKIDIINKLVEMEEKKILQEKYLKECRMRPLKANFSDGKGTVKILSRNFEKLASKHQNKNTLEAADFFSLTYDDCDSDSEKHSVKKEIKRNLSLPDVLDGEKMDLVSCLEEKHVNNESGNLSSSKSENLMDIAMDSEIFCDSMEIDDKQTLNNAASIRYEDSHYVDTKTKDLKQRVYNVTVIPKTDIHLDSENYESSTTSSSCANSPKRLFFGNRQRASSKISSLFRSKFDRSRISAYGNIKTSPMKSSMESSANHAMTFSKTKPVIASGGLKSCPFTSTNTGLAKKLSLQQSMLPSKMAFVQGSRNRLPANDFHSLIADDSNSGLRRAISLSELAIKPSPSPRMTLQGKTNQNGSNNKLSNIGRTANRHSKQFSSNMTRSSSVGVLNQSDSESEAGTINGRGNGSRTGGLMRPTISSQNKAAPAVNRRRGVQAAYSSVNLSSVGQEDSSSEEAGGGNSGTNGNTTTNNKPIVPPRPPRGIIDSTGPGHRRNMGRSGSDRDLSNKAREVTHRLTSGAAPRKHSVPNQGTGDKQISINSLNSSDGQVTPLACQQLAQQLTKLTAKIVQMYSTLSGTPPGQEMLEAELHTDNADMLQGLEAAMLDAQKMLSCATRRPKINGIGGDQPLSLSSSTDGEGVHSVNSIPNKTVNNVTKRLDDLVSKGVPSKNGEINQGQAMSMMNQYSDILYTMVNDLGSTNNGKKYVEDAS